MRYRKPSIHSVSACEPRPSAASAAALYPRRAWSLDMAPLSRSARKPATASEKWPTSTQMTSRAEGLAARLQRPQAQIVALASTAKRGRPAPRRRQREGWPVNPAGRDAVRPHGARPPSCGGATPGEIQGRRACGSVTPQALRASYHGNVASIPSKRYVVGQKEVRSFADMSKEVYVAVALAGLAQLRRKRASAGTRPGNDNRAQA